ncbi:MAG: DNA polymerase I [Cyanobacteria bacterium RI_101]|nr:DNA polymerase I [Cyanobacteria bacterium RI_101]
MSPLLLLVDGHSLAFRAYYAFAKTARGPLRTAQGIPTSVCFGFLNSLWQTLESLKPQALGVAFDRREPTFRHEADANYKSDRAPTPEDFLVDLDYLHQLLTALNLPLLTYPGYEADDILGTLAEEGVKAGYGVKILSGDRDLFQLVDDQRQISVLYLSSNPLTRSATTYGEFQEPQVLEKMGVTPRQIVDYKALCGDKSDSIPGVAGIGEKTAVKLLREYGDLESVYKNLDQLKGAVKMKLEQGRESALHSQRLARIVTDVPLEIPLEALTLQGFDPAPAVPLLQKLELNSFLDKLPSLQTALGGNREQLSGNSYQETVIREQLSDNGEPAPGQLSLFAAAKAPKSAGVGAGVNWDAIPLAPRLITQEKQLRALIKTLETAPEPVAWDTETTGLDPWSAELIGLGCAWGGGRDELAYIPLGHKTGEQLPKEAVLTALAPILSSEQYPKVLQNAKFDRLILKHQGAELGGAVFDTLLASYLLQPELSHNLTDLGRRYLPNLAALSYKDLGLSKQESLADLDPQKAALYCGLDVHTTFLLREILAQALGKIPALERLFKTMELPLEPILAQMEDWGITLDVEYLRTLSQQLEQDLARIESAAYEAAGETFKLNSPKALGEILFEKLGLNRKKSRKTKTGYSTDHAALEKLQGDHPLIDHILDYRTLAKLKSTYVDALPNLVNPQTRRLHTDFNQAVTATGRLSSSNPNLQNIPIRTEFSRQIRRAFLPAPGWLLVAADYSQIELRILAHLSQEPLLIEAYQTGQDVHRLTAQLLLDKEDVSPQERNLGKTINFGVIYGMGAQRFAREAGVGAEEGRDFIRRYRQTYQGVFAYLEQTKKQALAQGFVETICGRRRYFDFVSETARNLRGQAPETIDLEALELSYQDSQLLRAAANAPIQGSSADIIKLAMVQLAPRLAQTQARLLLQVHDELVLEMPPEEWARLKTPIQTTMEQAVTLSVPLKVEIQAGANWLEAK